MAGRSRKKQRSVIGTLFVELSALAGILGIAQPSIRDSVWRAIQAPPSHSSSYPGLPTPTQQTHALPMSMPPTTASQNPAAYLRETPRFEFYGARDERAPAYTAQAVISPTPLVRERWNTGGFRPMGSFQ